MSRLAEENLLLRSKAERPSLTGSSQAISKVRSAIARVAPTDSWVLITGDNGTGKELVAHAIHRLSPREGHPFVDVNCAAIPEELIESELFGHEKGAFTGATGKKRGKFDLAHQGTIFLDEIADMSLKTQAKILRILQEQRFERVGGTKTIAVDVRVLAATNKNLQGRDRGRPLPRGPLLPPQRDPHPRAAPGRARRGHPRAGGRLFGPSGREAQPAGQALHFRRPWRC